MEDEAQTRRKKNFRHHIRQDRDTTTRARNAADELESFPHFADNSRDREQRNEARWRQAPSEDVQVYDSVAIEDCSQVTASADVSFLRGTTSWVRSTTRRMRARKLSMIRRKATADPSTAPLASRAASLRMTPREQKWCYIPGGGGGGYIPGIGMGSSGMPIQPAR